MNPYAQPHHIADNVSRWTGLGITLPKDLEKAIEVFETIRYIEVGYRPQFDLAGVTEKNAETKIRDYADQLLLAGAAGGSSPLEKAKKDAVEAAARKVISLARTAVPDVVAQLTPDFEDHADAFATAVAQLPEDLNPESLITAGPDAVATYGTARAEAGYLANIAAWAAGLSELPGCGRDTDPVLGILRPETYLDLIELDKANSVPADPTVTALNPVFVAAARIGVPFGINSPRDAVALRRDLVSALKTAGSQRPDGVPTLQTIG